ncbi:MAG: molybdate transport system substrate-binding protein [Solirubrobacterales bacterium]|jgi:molybdate transport system substrate-binding protein|nr:molybdate transport system substrate-binding protein [Solirubrobacterales bacterium]
MRRALVLAAFLAALFAGCGSSGDTTGGGGSLVVLGASSLTEAVGKYAESFEDADVKTSFAGSDQLAAQIRQGAGADVFLSADTDYPAELFKEGLVEKPRPFAANQLVIAVPADSGLSSLSDLAQPGTKLVIGDPSVPVGSYTRTVLDRLPAAQRKAILANVRSEEPEVSSVIAKIEQGAADAGFVYVTDAKSAGEAVKTIGIPADLQPEVAYAGAVVADSANQDRAEEFLAGLIEGEGAVDLKRAGFLPPP